MSICPICLLVRRRCWGVGRWSSLLWCYELFDGGSRGWFSVSVAVAVGKGGCDELLKGFASMSGLLLMGGVFWWRQRNTIGGSLV